MSRGRGEGARALRPAVDFARPQTEGPHLREPGERQRGDRRERDRSRERRSFDQRLHAALVDVSVHRVAAYRDVVDAQFDGHPYTARRGIDQLKRGGLLQEREVAGPQGGSFKVLVATKGGARVAEKLVARQGFAPAQRTWAGVGRAADLTHDVAVYRVTREARRQLAEQGAAVVRVRLDAELRGQVASKSEAARVQHGKTAADRARRRAAEELHLPVLEDGQVAYPDAQLEYEIEGPDGPTSGRVNVEVASEHYRGEHIQAKADAGFAVFAANGKAGRAMSKAGIGRVARAAGREDVGGGGGGKGRDQASVEL